jgi:hypothetical protein
MTDLMQDWKDNKFVVVGQDFMNEIGYSHLVIMTDVKFWAAQVDQCIAWCHQNNCEIKGMTITIPNEETLALFLLKWS